MPKKPKSLKWRWFVDVFGVIVAVVVLALTVCSVMISSSYYTAVRTDLNSRIRMATGILGDYASSSEAEFDKAAQNFINNYTDRKTAEVQVINSSGRIIASSLGVIQDYSLPGGFSRTGTYGNIYESVGKIGDEKIMLMTADMYDESGEVFGSVRFAVSLDRIDNQLLRNVIVISSAGLVVIGLVMLTGLFFIRSIISPVKKVTHAAQTIAAGKFDERIDAEKQSGEIKALCDSINFMAQELAAADSVKNEFISSVSHELRTPLTAIKGWGETIRDSGVSDPLILDKGINIIINESERMTGLVEDLLDFSRLESGRLKINPTEIDISEPLTEAVGMYEEAASKLGVVVNFTLPSGLPRVLADKNRLKQVFINVIDNAVKYSTNGGTVTVECSLHDVFVRVTVRDMGCGIAKEDLPRVKEKFYKANKTVRGSGIGLAVADEIVRQHNGFLEIDSVEGYGTTVMIELPFIPEEGSSGE